MPDAFDDVFGAAVAEPKAPAKEPAPVDAFDDVFGATPASPAATRAGAEAATPPELDAQAGIGAEPSKTSVMRRLGHVARGHGAGPVQEGAYDPVTRKITYREMSDDEVLTKEYDRRFKGVHPKRLSENLDMGDADAIVKRQMGPNATLPEGMTAKRAKKFVEEYTRAHSDLDLTTGERVKVFGLALADQAARGLTFNKLGASDAARLMYDGETARELEGAIGEVSASSGTAGKFALGMANIGGSLIPFNRLASAFGGGAAKFGASPAVQSTIATTLTMGTYSAIAEDEVHGADGSTRKATMGDRVRSFGKGAAFGFFAGAAGANFRELLKGLPPLVQMSVAEGAGFAYAGQVVNGGPVEDRVVDFMLGAALGARGGREFARRNNGLNTDGTFKPVSEWQVAPKEKPLTSHEKAMREAPWLEPEAAGIAPEVVAPAAGQTRDDARAEADKSDRLTDREFPVAPEQAVRPAVVDPAEPVREAARAPDAFDAVFPPEPVRPEVMDPARREDASDRLTDRPMPIPAEEAVRRPVVDPEATPPAPEAVRPVEPAPVEPPASARPEAPKVEAPARHPETEEVVRTANEHVRKIEEEWGGSEPPKPPERPAEPTNPDDLTSVKNRMVNRDRVKRGLGELREPLTRGQEEVVNRAIDRLADNPDAGKMLVEELNTKHRPLSDEDVAVLTIHRKNLRDAVKAADRAGIEAAKANNGEGDPGKIEAAKKIADEANNALLQSEFAAHGGGTETARGLAMRRIEMKNDYSLEKMRFDRLRENGYKELSRDRQAVQDKQTEELHKRIKTALEERDAAVTRADALEAERKFRETVGEARSRKAPPGAKALDGSKNKIVTKEVADAALARILERARNPQTNIAFDPTWIKDYVIRGAYHVERGVRGLAEWTASMVSEFGDEVRPHLEEIWPAAQAQLRDATIGEFKAKVAEKMKAGKGVDEMSSDVGKLFDMFAHDGITERESLIDKVHEVMKGLDPSIERIDVMKSYVKYGAEVKKEQDPVRVALQQTRGEIRELVKLDEMAKKRKPLSSGGVDYPTPGDEWRALTKKVNEGKKKAIAEGWWKEETSPGQLRSSLDAAKRRATNELKDLQKQIDARVRDIPVKTDAPTDPELLALRAQLVEKRKEFRETFNTTGLSDVQRAERAAKSAERSAAEWERKITTGKIEPTTGGKKQGPLTEAQQRAKDLREYVAELRDLARPHRTPEEIAQKTLMTYLRNREAMFQKRVDSGKLEPAPRVVRPRNKEANEAQAKVDIAQRAWAEALVRDRLAKRTGWEKAADFPGEVQATMRAVMTSMDLSSSLKQGGIDAIINPLQWARAFKPSFEALRSPEGLARAEAEMRAHPDFALAKQAGLKFNEANGSDITKMEEVYQSRFIEKIPTALGGGLVRGSSRQFTTFLNKIRLDSFSTALRSLKGGEAPTLAEAKHLAEWANIKSGSGTGRWADGAASMRTFFAPRLFVSRFQFLFAPVGVMWRKGSTPRTRWRVAQEWGRFMAGAAALQILRSLATGDDDTDFADPDQTKVTVGDSHIGTIPGMGPEMALIGKWIRDAAYEADSRIGLDLVDKREGLGSWDATTRFLRAKLNPSLGAAVNVIHGKDFNNQPTKILPTDAENLGEAVGLMTPMVARDLIRIWRQDYGLPVKGLVTIASMLGMGVNTYPPREKKKSKSSRYTGGD